MIIQKSDSEKLAELKKMVFVDNCGMSKVFSYFIKSGTEVTEVKVLLDVSNCIQQTVDNIFSYSSNGLELVQATRFFVLNKIDK